MLKPVGLDNPFQYLAFFCLDETRLHAFLGDGGPVITDDRPRNLFFPPAATLQEQYDDWAAAKRGESEGVVDVHRPLVDPGGGDRGRDPTEVVCLAPVRGHEPMNGDDPRHGGRPASGHALGTVVRIVGGALLVLLVLGGRGMLYRSEPARPPATEPVLHLADDQADITVLYHQRTPYYKNINGVVRGTLRGSGSAGGRARPASASPGPRCPAIWQLELIRRNEKPVCGLGWFKTPEREIFARFSASIYRDMPSLALSRAMDERIPPLTDLAEIIGNRRLILLRKAG